MTASARALTLDPRQPVPLPTGRRLYAEDIAKELWGDTVSTLWIHRKMRKLGHKPGRKMYWYESDAVKFRDDYEAAERQKRAS